jgi:hypothetical protein
MDMPPPPKAFAAVAAALADIDPADSVAVAMFYRNGFTRFSLPARAVIADFLGRLTAMPTDEDLRRLWETVALPTADLPVIEAPAWKDAGGPDWDKVPPRDRPPGDRKKPA